MPKDLDELNAAKDYFEKECRARPGSLREITSRYILKRFEIQASRIKHAGFSEASEDYYPKALGQLVKAELDEASRIVFINWRAGQLPFLKNLHDILSRRKADLETAAFEAARQRKNTPNPFQIPPDTPVPQTSQSDVQPRGDPYAIKPDIGSDQPTATDGGAVPVAQAPATPAAEGAPDKGNLAILCGTDGKLKRAVTLDVARRFGGVSRRAIQDAARKNTLKTEGKHHQRRVLVDSLLAYFPPEKIM